MHTEYQTPQVQAMAKVFEDMSRERDKPSGTKTTGTIRSTEDGYEQEIISTSTPRPRYGKGDQVETVTKRVVKTASGPPSDAGDPLLQVRMSSGTRLRDEVQQQAEKLPNTPRSRTSTPTPARPLKVTPLVPLPSGSAGSTSADAAVTPAATAGPRPLPLRSASQTSSVASPAAAGGQWRSAPQPTKPVPRFDGRVADDEAATATTTTTTTIRPESRGRSRAPRNLMINTTHDTRYITPSRVSPLHVDREYAPVKYLTRGALRKLRREQSQQADAALGRNIRRSSIPRFDAERRERELELRNDRFFRGQDDFRTDLASTPEHEHRYYGQKPLPSWVAGGSPTYHEVPRQVRAEDPAEADHGPQQFWGSPTSPPIRASRRATSARPPPRTVVRSSPSYQPPPHAQHAPDYAGTVASPPAFPRRSASVTSASLAREAGPNAPGLLDGASLLCGARGIQRPPPPPPYAIDAFRLLNFGTYLVKYGRNGSPKERFVALRVLLDESGRAQLYFVWALHEDSNALNERINVVHLMSATPGADGTSFQRHLLGPGTVRGPHVGSKQSALPIDFAFRVHFQSTTQQRYVDLLALDDQTFRCWILVLQYLASINQSGDQALPSDFDTLPAESVRSGSASAR